MRFYKPQDTEYKDTFVQSEMPWELVLGAVGKEQATYDKAVSDAKKAAFDQDAYEYDKLRSSALSQEYKNKFEAIKQKIYSGDYRTGASDISNIVSEYKEDPRTKQIAENLAAAKAYDIMEANKKEKADQLYNLTGATSEYAQSAQDLTKPYVFRPQDKLAYTRQIQDYATKFQEDIKDIKPETFGQEFLTTDKGIPVFKTTIDEKLLEGKLTDIAKNLAKSAINDPTRSQYIADKMFGEAVDLNQLSDKDKKILEKRLVKEYEIQGRKQLFKNIKSSKQQVAGLGDSGSGAGEGGGVLPNEWSRIQDELDANDGVARTTKVSTAAALIGAEETETKGHYLYTPKKNNPVIVSFGKNPSKQELVDNKTLEQRKVYENILNESQVDKDSFNNLYKQSISEENKDALRNKLAGIGSVKGFTIKRNTVFDELPEKLKEGRKKGQGVDNFVLGKTYTITNNDGTSKVINYEEALNLYEDSGVDKKISEFKNAAAEFGIDISMDNIKKIQKNKIGTLTEKEIIDKKGLVLDDLSAAIPLTPSRDMISDNQGNVYNVSQTEPLTRDQIEALGLSFDDLERAGALSKATKTKGAGTIGFQAEAYQIKMMLPVMGDTESATINAQYGTHGESDVVTKDLNTQINYNKQKELNRSIINNAKRSIAAQSIKSKNSPLEFKTSYNSIYENPEAVKYKSVIDKAYSTKNYDKISKLNFVFKHGVDAFERVYPGVDVDDLLK